MIQIKEIKHQDYLNCYYFDSNSFKFWNKIQWENELRKNNVRSLGIYSKNLIVGICVFLLIFEEAELRYFSISPNHKRRGLGRKLFKKFLEICKKENINKIFLEVSINNKEAIGFYECFRFKTIGVRKNYYKDGSDALLKEKKC